MEEKVPSIRKSPEELKSVGWGTYESLVTYGSERLQSIKSFVATQASNASETPVAHVVMRGVDSALGLAEQALDHLPLGQDEEATDEAGSGEKGGSDSEQASHQANGQPPKPSDVVERAGRVSDKMRRRILRSDLLLVKRALSLLAPLKELTSTATVAADTTAEAR